MCHLSFKYLRYSSSLDYIYWLDFGPIKDWQPNSLSIKTRGKVLLAATSSAQQLALEEFVISSLGATQLQNLFFPEEPQRQSSMEGEKKNH